jgi:ribosomal subunit interface protein
MQVPVKITFHNLDESDALEARIHEKIAKLEIKFPHLVSMHVTVDSAHNHQHKGKLYSVKIDVTLPGGILVVSHHTDKSLIIKHEKIYAAMNDSFDAIERQLDKYVDSLRGA